MACLETNDIPLSLLPPGLSQKEVDAVPRDKKKETYRKVKEIKATVGAQRMKTGILETQVLGQGVNLRLLGDRSTGRKINPTIPKGHRSPYFESRDES